jgi:4-diphosphocytidyl-2-C-methyl-D-erythritol kinase
MVGMNRWDRYYPAPAKLNLFLHVVGRRADGYHLLQTAFRLIDRCDRLRYAPRDDGRVTLARPLPGIDESTELSLRAARLLLAESGSQHGVEIEIEKNIPVGGGLGGGSSDAATTLAVLNQLLRLRASADDLARLGLRLGADVPFFLFGENAFGEGIGERLSPLPLPAAWYVVLVPPVVVSTRAIFTAPELTPGSKTIKISSFSAGFGGNDLEPIVCRRHEEVAAHLAWLRRFGDARLSGSGACVFAEFASEHEARDVLSRIPVKMRGFAVRGLERHPLTELLGQG